MKHLKIIVALLLAAAVAASPGPAQEAECAEKLTASYRTTYEDEPDLDNMPWAQKAMVLTNAVTTHLTIEKQKGVTVYTFKEKLGNGATRVSEYKYELGEKWKWAGAEITVTNKLGEKIQRNKLVPGRECLGYPEDILPAPYGLYMAASEVKLKTGTKKLLVLQNSPNIIYRARLRVEDREQIEIPAGEFECYKVVVEPFAKDYFGNVVGAIIQRFVPKYYLWVEAKKPHRVLRYKGVLGEMPTTANIWETRELVK